MASNNTSAAVPVPIQPPQPPSPPQNATSPPSRRDLASWWKRFNRQTRKAEEKVQAPVGIFGVPLGVSIKYANVAISLTNEKGESYIYGYVPIVVAKCGVFLKEKATETEGIFRIGGSVKRINELQQIFNSPDRYGKGLDWTGYTVHDAANILRRYLNQLPQPMIPLDFYERCREPLRGHQGQAVGSKEGQDVGGFNSEAAIASYQKLITELPPLNRQLLLYILDLLAVFASKSEINRMTAANLSAIFQPGLLSHPNHDMSPADYRLSQDVLIFLIENQDNFLVGMSGTAADEKTVQEVQSGAQPQPATPPKSTRAGLGRSASNASGGADSLRRVGGGLRRNLSISSKHSRGSSNAPSPGSPAAGSPLVNASPGRVYRSNTVPSRRSPRVSSNCFPSTNGEPEPANTNELAPADQPAAERSPSPLQTLATNTESQATVTSSSSLSAEKPTLTSVPENHSREVSRELHSSEGLSLRPSDQGVVTTITSAGTPVKERKSFFSKSPTSDTERKDGRQPKKLQKKNRVQTTSNNVSAQSSTHSLSGHGESSKLPAISNTEASPSAEQPPQLADIDKMSAFHVSHHTTSHTGSPALKPAKSPVPSMHSKTSGAEDSEAERAVNGTSKDGKKRHSRWRLSSTSKPHDTEAGSHSGSRLGSSAVAEKSESSVASAGKPQKSETFNSQHTATGTDVSAVSGHHVSSAESTPSRERETSKDGEEKEKKGPIGWFKAKVAHAKEEREERKAEKGAGKERAKSPPPSSSEHTTSKNSLNALTQEGTSAPSTEKPVEASTGTDPDIPEASKPKE